MKARRKLAASPKEQLDSFFAKYDPAIAAFGRRVLVELRKRLPGAVELVYDNYNGLVVGFGPNERPSLAIFSIVLFPRWVTLCFLQGAKLPDPQRRLAGQGNVVRHMRLENLAVLYDPEVERLINLAHHRAKVLLDPKNRRQQRPRKPLAKN